MDSVNSEKIIKEKEKIVQDRVADFYEAERYRRPYSLEWHNRNMKRMIDLVSQNNLNGLILDNGCGNGILGNFLPKEKIVGSDLSPEMLKLASVRLGRVVEADSENLPFGDGEFDTVFARSLLHHLPNPSKGVEECYRVLKTGGQVVFQDTLMSVFSYLPRKVANWQGKHFSASHKNFRYHEIVDLVGQKFKIEKIIFSGYFAYFLGFPDIVDVTRFIPLKKIMIPFLYLLDNLLEKIPYLNRQSWGIIILARKI